MLRDMTKVVKAGEWLTEHLSIQEYFEDLYVEHYRGGLVPGVTEEVCQTVIDHAGEEVDFTAADLKTAWDKHYYNKVFRKPAA
ncbi:MAG: hypothetical protein SOV71_07990 [Anaerovoracaceae bacterium]|nr:hypothetical protein [Bacillota bacterium]MDY2671470.1 hypothetical protein [Anaerovoracaceae bacterium]